MLMQREPLASLQDRVEYSCMRSLAEVLTEARYPESLTSGVLQCLTRGIGSERNSVDKNRIH